MKKGFDERLIGYFSEDVGRWAVRVRDLGYRLRRLTMSHRRPYEAGPVPVPAFKHTVWWQAVAESLMAFPKAKRYVIAGVLVRSVARRYAGADGQKRVDIVYVYEGSKMAIVHGV